MLYLGYILLQEEHSVVILAPDSLIIKQTCKRLEIAKNLKLLCTMASPFQAIYAAIDSHSRQINIL